MNTSDRDYPTTALLAEKLLTDRDIRDAELERARHALAYLKRKIGNEAMREWLNDDLAEMTIRVRDWVGASGGA